MKKLLIISLLGLSMLSCSKHSENNASPYTQLKIPKCKNEEIKKEEYNKFIDELTSQGYKIDGAILDDMNFNVWVIDQQGNRILKTKQWCKIGE